MDKYDAQIAGLLESDNFLISLVDQWTNGIDLFAFATPTGDVVSYCGCGCLTMIMNGMGKVIDKSHEPNEKLTLAIKSDHRIPKSISEITPGNLQVFAEWQRRIDKELRNG